MRVSNVRRVFHNGEHNAFTDLVRFRGRLYLTFRSCPDGHMVHPTASIIILASTDANGRFTLKDVPAGRDLHIYAETKDHALASSAVYPAPADANKLTSMELVLLPTEAAIALIKDDEGRPVSSLTLTIVPMVAGAKIWRAERTGETDETGLLQIDGIVPGLTYFLRDARFDSVGPRPKDRSEWFQGKEMVLLPLEP